MDKILFCPNNRNILGNRIDYLITHWQDVDYFVVGESDKPFSTCRLEVYFISRKRILVYFGNLADAWEVANQPLFSGKIVYWFGRRYEIKHESNSLHSIFENNPRAN